MHKSYFLCGLVFALSLWTADAQPENIPAEDNSEREIEVPQTVSPQLAIVESDVDIKTKEIIGKKKRARADQNLLAQQGMNKSTKSMALDTRLQTILLFLGTCALIWTLLETRRVGSITEKSARIQNQAYLLVVEPNVRVTSEIKNPRITLHIKNSGKTPAKWFRLDGYSSSSPWEKDSIVFDKRRSSSATLGTWHGIGAEDERTVGFRPDGLEDHIRSTVQEEDNVLQIGGRVFYETISGERFYSEFHFFSRGLNPAEFEHIQENEADTDGLLRPVKIKRKSERTQRMSQPPSQLEVFKKSE